MVDQAIQPIRYVTEREWFKIMYEREIGPPPDKSKDPKKKEVLKALEEKIAKPDKDAKNALPVCLKDENLLTLDWKEVPPMKYCSCPMTQCICNVNKLLEKHYIPKGSSYPPTFAEKVKNFFKKKYEPSGRFFEKLTLAVKTEIAVTRAMQERGIYEEIGPEYCLGGCQNFYIPDKRKKPVDSDMNYIAEKRVMRDEFQQLQANYVAHEGGLTDDDIKKSTKYEIFSDMTGKSGSDLHMPKRKHPTCTIVKRPYDKLKPQDFDKKQLKKEIKERQKGEKKLKQLENKIRKQREKENKAREKEIKEKQKYEKELREKQYKAKEKEIKEKQKYEKEFKNKNEFDHCDSVISETPTSIKRFHEPRVNNLTCGDDTCLNKKLNDDGKTEQKRSIIDIENIDGKQNKQKKKQKVKHKNIKAISFCESCDKIKDTSSDEGSPKTKKSPNTSKKQKKLKHAPENLISCELCRNKIDISNENKNHKMGHICDICKDATSICDPCSYTAKDTGSEKDSHKTIENLKGSMKKKNFKHSKKSSRKTSSKSTLSIKRLHEPYLNNSSCGDDTCYNTNLNDDTKFINKPRVVNIEKPDGKHKKKMKKPKYGKTKSTSICEPCEKGKDTSSDKESIKSSRRLKKQKNLQHLCECGNQKSAISKICDICKNATSFFDPCRNTNTESKTKKSMKKKTSKPALEDLLSCEPCDPCYKNDKILSSSSTETSGRKNIDNTIAKRSFIYDIEPPKHIRYINCPNLQSSSSSNLKKKQSSASLKSFSAKKVKNIDGPYKKNTTAEKLIKGNSKDRRKSKDAIKSCLNSHSSVVTVNSDSRVKIMRKPQKNKEDTKENVLKPLTQNISNPPQTKNKCQHLTKHENFVNSESLNKIRNVKFEDRSIECSDTSKNTLQNIGFVKVHNNICTAISKESVGNKNVYTTFSLNKMKNIINKAVKKIKKIKQEYENSLENHSNADHKETCAFSKYNSTVSFTKTPSKEQDVAKSTITYDDFIPTHKLSKKNIRYLKRSGCIPPLSVTNKSKAANDFDEMNTNYETEDTESSSLYSNKRTIRSAKGIPFIHSKVAKIVSNIKLRQHI